MNTENASSTGLARSTRVAAWLAVLLGIVGLAGMLSSGPLYRIGALSLGHAFLLMGLGAKVGVAAIIVGVIALIMSLLAHRGRFTAIAVLAIVLGVLAFLPPWMFRHRAALVPPIHDISTDIVNPPAFKSVLPLRVDAPNSPVYGGAQVADQQVEAYPDIKPVQLPQSPQAVFEAALKVAQAMDWKIQAQDAAQGHIEATSTTFWYGFKDDVVIRIRAHNGGSRLDVRSESRVGKSDVGKNAERIRDFVSQLKNQLGTA